MASITIPAVIPSGLEIALYSVVYFAIALTMGVVLNHVLPKPKLAAKVAEATLQVLLHVSAISVVAWLITRVVATLPLPNTQHVRHLVAGGGVLFAGALLAAQPTLQVKVDIMMARLGQYWKWVQ